MSALAGRTKGAAKDIRDTVFVGDLEVDRAPVTNARYLHFVQRTGHRPPLYWPQGRCPHNLIEHPVVGVDLFDALAFAFWSGGALPTEEEWIAATGLEQPAAFAWGDSFEASRCNTVRSDIKGTSPVGSHPDGTAPSGCVDLCGNVWELTCSAFDSEHDSVIVKGGSWYDFPAHARLDTRFRARINKGGTTVGFRLVYGRGLILPHFLNPALVAECIAYRHGDAPYREESEEGGEFDAIVNSLRETARSSVPQLKFDEENGPGAEAVEEALSLLEEVDAPADEATRRPRRRPVRRRPRPALTFGGRLRKAARELSRATVWQRFGPTFRALLRNDLERTWRDRLSAAWAEARRPLPGPTVLRACFAAFARLWPSTAPDALPVRLEAAWSELQAADGAMPLWKRLRLSWQELMRLRGVRPFQERKLAALDVMRRTAKGPTLRARIDAAATALRSEEAKPSLWERTLGSFSYRPRTMFIVLCFAAGVVAGVIGATLKQDPEPTRGTPERARVSEERPAREQRQPRARKPRVKTPTPPVEEPEAPVEEPEAPANAPESVRAAIQDILSADPRRSGNGEQYLIGHPVEAEDSVKAVLRTRLKPEARATFKYVLSAIEEKAYGAGSATISRDPPRSGLLFFTNTLDGVEEQLADVRRTAQAHNLLVTVILSAGSQSDQIATEKADSVGGVFIYPDPDARYTNQMRVSRLPAVAGLHRDGRLAFLLLGELNRARLVKSVLRLR